MSAVLERPPQTIFYPESDGKPMGETDIHRNLMAYLIDSLALHFQARPDVYVTGNIMFYYVEGNPRKSISPDVMVCFGVEKKLRRTYKLWAEGCAPSVVIEISSRATWNEDLKKKLALYEQMGVAEYYVFDPEYDYLNEPLLAYRLMHGQLVRVEVVNGCIYSPVLDLELVDTGVTLRPRDPRTGLFLPTMAEMHEERQREYEARMQEQAARESEQAARVQEHEARMQEQAAREIAEAEVARLRAELEKLKNINANKIT